jgi:hypothetical protein
MVSGTRGANVNQDIFEILIIYFKNIVNPLSQDPACNNFNERP